MFLQEIDFVIIQSDIPWYKIEKIHYFNITERLNRRYTLQFKLYRPIGL